MNPTWTLNGFTAVGTPDLPPCEAQSLVTQVGDGFFVARGHPRTRFNYVIHPAP